MGKLADCDKRRAYEIALSNWRYSGYVVFSENAEKWLRKNIRFYTIKHMSCLLYQYVRDAGEVDYVHETRGLELRDEELIRDCHYDLRILIDGRLVYFETVLDDDDPNDLRVFVVNAHDP